MTIKLISTCLIAMLMSATGNAQTFDKYYGASLGYDNYYLQAGVSTGHIYSFLSEKVNLNYDYNFKDNVHGINGGYSLGCFFIVGADMGVRFDKQTDYIVKPKVGLGFPALFSVNYGYDIYINRPKGNAVWSFEVNIPIKQKPCEQNRSFLFGLLKM